MKRVWNYAISMWQPVGLILISGLLIAFLFSYKLGGLVKGISVPEQTTITQSLGVRNILNNPVNTPYKSAIYIVGKVHNSLAVKRLVSGFVAGLSVILLYLLARRFTEKFAAATAAVMYATSSALLHNGRLAIPGITVLSLLYLLTCGFQIRFSSHRTRSLFLSTIVLALSLYTPGILYFIIAGSIWQYKAIKRSYELPKLNVSLLAGGIFIVLLLPLLLGFVQHPGIWREYLLIPKILPHIKNFLIQLFAVPAGVIAFAPKSALYRLGRQPLLDAFSAVMFIIGLYTLFRRYKLDRLVLFGGIFALGIILTAFSGNYEYSLILVPFIYLVIAVGIGMMLDSWRKTFPYNPLARSLALVIIGVAVLVSVNFQTRRYFVAWPHNDVTRAAFTNNGIIMKSLLKGAKL